MLWRPKPTMRLVPIKLVLTMVMSSGAAFSQGFQNMEFSFLVGVTPSTTQSISGSNIAVSTTDGFFFQHNIAHQLVSAGPGDLYFELPMTLSFSQTGSTSAGARVSSGSAFLITPGVRYKIPLWARLSLYGALGGGGGSL